MNIKKALLMLTVLNITLIATATGFKYFVAKDNVNDEVWWRGIAAISFLFGAGELLGLIGLFHYNRVTDNENSRNYVRLIP